MVSGCGSAVGGPTNGTKATFVGSASRKPKCVADAENRVRMERLAKLDAERRENKPKPTVDDFILDRGLQVWNDAVGKYMKLGRAVSRRERVETENDEEWDQSLTYSATPYEVIASAILRIRRWEWARSERVIQYFPPSTVVQPRSTPFHSAPAQLLRKS